MNGVVYGEQFYRLDHGALVDGAPYSAGLARRLGRNANALKAAALPPPLVSEHRTSPAACALATTDAGLVLFWPELYVPDGYLRLRGHALARKQSASLNPSLLLYSDDAPPRGPTGEDALGPSAAAAVVEVVSEQWLWYPILVHLARSEAGTTYLSLWGQAAEAGASKQADVLDLDLWVEPLEDDGEIEVDPVPVVTPA